MADILFRALEGQDAEVWAETHLLRVDVVASIDAMSLLAAQYIDKPTKTARTSLLPAAFFVMLLCALSAASMPPTKNIGSRLTIYMEQEPRRAKTLMLRSVRNAFIAHRFGALRQAVFAVAMSPGGRKFTMAHAMTHRHPDQDEAKRIIDVMRVAEAHLTRKEDELHARLVAAFKALSAAEFSALAVAELYHEIRLHEIAMPRRTFLRKRRAGGGGVTVSVDETLFEKD